MRLVTYESDFGWRSAVQVGDLIVDAAKAAENVGLSSPGDHRWASTKRIIWAGPAVIPPLESSAESLAVHGNGPWLRNIADVRLGPPVPDPAKIICLGLNYRDHAVETSQPTPPAPILFSKFANSLGGPHDDIIIPSATNAVDYEGELAVVIGKVTKDVPAESAVERLAGVMAFNDVSARDLQHQTSQWMAGKALDTFAPCGPALVTLDEVGLALPQLRVRTRLNATVVQDDLTSSMIFSIGETIAFISKLMTLEPGDIIATGTPAGTGFHRKPKLLLQPGDVIEVEIEGVGTLQNKVTAATQSPIVKSTN